MWGEKKRKGSAERRKEKKGEEDRSVGERGDRKQISVQRRERKRQVSMAVVGDQCENKEERIK